MEEEQPFLNYDSIELNENFFIDLGRLTEEEKEKKSICQNIFGRQKNSRSYFNSDCFFRDVYDYFYKGGYMSIVLTGITDIISLLFGTGFLAFIFIFLDWGKILQCGANNEIKDCGELYIYIKPRYPNIFFVFTLAIACIFTFCKIFMFISNYNNLKFIHNFYKNELKISSKELQTMQWPTVIDRISRHHKINIGIEDITNKIMRDENYFIALIHKNVLDIIPFFYTRQLEFNLRHIIISDLENINSNTLKKKFIFYGILNLFFSLFIFVYLITHFFASNIDDFYSNKNLGSRRYSLLAQSQFRDYNELQHFFEKRLNKSIKYSYEYIKQFPSPEVDVICKFISLISGAFIGLFLILSILDESILLYVRLFDRSLIFYTGIFGAISACARSFIKAPENTIYNPSEIMEKIYKYTHYMPAEWVNKCNSYRIRDEFLVFFPYTLLIFVQDLISVFMTPIILLRVMPNYADDIAHFVQQNTVNSPIGKICTFANFEIKIDDKKMSMSISCFKENHSLTEKN